MENRQNITGMVPSVYNSQIGYANQLIACGILLKLGYEASLAETGNSFYDLIVILDDNGVTRPIKTGVRTMGNSLSFTVNTGGGQNRPRPTGRGPQLPSLDVLQLWIGVTNDYSLYYMPHRLIVNRQRLRNGVYKPIGSLSRNSISHTLDNTDILDNFFDNIWMQTNVLDSIPRSHTWI